MIWLINWDFRNEVTLSASGLAFLILKISLDGKNVIWEIKWTKSCSRDDGVHSLLKMCHGKTSTKTILFLMEWNIVSAQDKCLLVPLCLVDILPHRYGSLEKKNVHGTYPSLEEETWSHLNLYTCHAATSHFRPGAFVHVKKPCSQLGTMQTCRPWRLMPTEG